MSDFFRLLLRTISASQPEDFASTTQFSPLNPEFNVRVWKMLASEKMISAIFNEPNYLAMRKTLDATVLRHEAIASNVANIETPNYKRVDIQPSFSSELAQALKTGDTKIIQAVQPSLVVDESAVASTKDGNTVQLETEMLKLSENTLSHNLETMWISGTFQDLRIAITGKIS